MSNCNSVKINARLYAPECAFVMAFLGRLSGVIQKTPVKLHVRRECLRFTIHVHVWGTHTCIRIFDHVWFNIGVLAITCNYIVTLRPINCRTCTRTCSTHIDQKIKNVIEVWIMWPQTGKKWTNYLNGTWDYLIFFLVFFSQAGALAWISSNISWILFAIANGPPWLAPSKFQPKLMAPLRPESQILVFNYGINTYACVWSTNAYKPLQKLSRLPRVPTYKCICTLISAVWGAFS